MEITEHERVLLVNSLIQTISELYEHDPQNDRPALGQQVAAVAGYLLQVRYSGGRVGFGHGAPPGMARGRAGQPGHDQPVSCRS